MEHCYRNYPGYADSLGPDVRVAGRRQNSGDLSWIELDCLDAEVEGENESRMMDSFVWTFHSVLLYLIW